MLAHLEHEVYYSRGYPNDSYSFVYPDVLLTLADHPLLFDGTSGAPATIAMIEPSARLTSEDGTTRILVEPPLAAGWRALERTGEGRFRFVVFTEAYFPHFSDAFSPEFHRPPRFRWTPSLRGSR